MKFPRIKNVLFIIGIVSLVLLSHGVSAQETQVVTPKTTASGNPASSFEMGAYTPLAPLPGFTKVIDSGVQDGGAGSFTLASYVKTLVRIAIGVIGVLAVVMIVISGIQYMGSDMITEKEDAKGRLTGAIFGLILAISSVLILRTINPQLTNLSIGDRAFKEGVTQNANVIYTPKAADLEGDAGVPTNYSGLSSLPNGAFCPKSGKSGSISQIATSFKGKNTYRFGGGHSSKEPPFPSEKSSWICEGKQCKTFCPSGTSCLDCSAFVNQVLECAGYPRFDGATGAMVANKNSEKVKTITKTAVNGIDMKPGDLLFWNGHVVIYIGNGKTAESFGGNEGRKAGNSIAIQDADHYKGRITHIYRVK